MNRLLGKTAFITGAASGIGRASAVRFAEEGAAVAIADIDERAGTALEDSIRASGGRSRFVRTDVTEEASVRQAIDTCVAEFGPIDVCYSNAGGSSSRDGSVTEIDIDEWFRVQKVDLFGTFLVCRCGIPAMGPSGGSIITTASMAAIVGSRQNAYSAAKGGVLALTRSIAKSYRDAGVRANTLVPGAVATQRVAAILARKESPTNVEYRRKITASPEAVADAALFLASDESAMITGSMIVVDRGITSLGPEGLL